MNLKKKFDQVYFDFYNKIRQKSAKARRVKDFRKKGLRDTLTPEQKSLIKEYFAPYERCNDVFHNYFTQKTGDFCVNYMPFDIYVGYVDTYFNDVLESRYLGNKCYFGALFYDIPQPDTLAMRVNNIWFLGSREGIAMDDDRLKSALMAEDGFFLKNVQESGGGFAVSYIDGEDRYQKVLKLARVIKHDIIIQRKILQHAALAAVNPSSVNSLRLYSVLNRDGSVKIYSSVLRVGIGDAKIDNFSSGGFAIGIDENGRLRKFGYNKDGDRTEKHPTTGLVFENYEIPSFAQAVALVHKAHPMVPHFRSVSWDIAIAEDGKPILIEANLCRGGAHSHQLCNGPLYGDDTKKILDEVFGKN